MISDKGHCVGRSDEDARSYACQGTLLLIRAKKDRPSCHDALGRVLFILSSSKVLVHRHTGMLLVYPPFPPQEMSKDRLSCHSCGFPLVNPAKYIGKHDIGSDGAIMWLDNENIDWP